MKSEHVVNSDSGLLRHKRGDLDLCMSELNLTLTAKPFMVLTRVKWAQNATILHYAEVRNAPRRFSSSRNWIVDDASVELVDETKSGNRVIAAHRCAILSPISYIESQP